jgi:hypothetical protein
MVTQGQHGMTKAGRKGSVVVPQQHSRNSSMQTSSAAQLARTLLCCEKNVVVGREQWPGREVHNIPLVPQLVPTVQPGTRTLVVDLPEGQCCTQQAIKCTDVDTQTCAELLQPLVLVLYACCLMPGASQELSCSTGAG